MSIKGELSLSGKSADTICFFFFLNKQNVKTSSTPYQVRKEVKYDAYVLIHTFKIFNQSEKYFALIYLVNSYNLYSNVYFENEWIRRRTIK